MKLPKIIIATVAILLLLGIASLPTLYSKLLIEVIGEHMGPEGIEQFYGDFDVEISRSEYNKYYAYKISNNPERYLVIYFYDNPKDEMQIEFFTYKGTDWIEEVDGK